MQEVRAMKQQIGIPKRLSSERTGEPGVTDTFEDFAAERLDSLMPLARLLTGQASDAEDLVQDALVRAHDQWHKVAAAQNPNAYVRRLLINVYTSQHRRLRLQTVPLNKVHDNTAAPTLGVELSERDTLRQAIRALPIRQRTAIVLRYYEDLDVSEIAASMGLTESSVRSAVSRALDNIRTCHLQAQTGDDPCATSKRR